MKEVMRDIWCGRVILMEKRGNQNADMEDILRLMEKNKEILYTLIDEQQKDRFEKYTDCVEEYVSFITQRAFCEGVEFTAKFLVEALG